MSGGGGIGSEASDALRHEKDGQTARAQLHKEIELLEIMSARTCLDLLNLATMGDAVRMILQDSTSVALLRSLGAEIEKAKASIRELRREILEAKRERIEVLDGLDGFVESHPSVHKQVGSRSTEKQRSMFNGVISGITALVITFSILGVRARGDKNRK